MMVNEQDFMIEEPPKEKKKFLGIFGSNKDEKSDIIVGDKDMPSEFDFSGQGPPNNDIMAQLLGGAFGGGGQQGLPMPQGPQAPTRSQFYQDDWQYQGINDGYKPIGDTYQAPKYQKANYQSFQYKSPEYESAADDLFGPARGQPFLNSPVYKETGVREALMIPSEKNAFTSTGMNDNLFGGSLADSPLFKPTGMNDQLFRDLNVPIMEPETAQEPLMATPAPGYALSPGNMTTLFGTPIDMTNRESAPSVAIATSTPELTSEQEAAVAEVFPETTPIEEVVTETPVGSTVAMPADSAAIPTIATTPYVPRPTVQMKPQLSSKRGPGRPRLSDEEKARRKAARMSEASMVAQ
jgi:hypothetical protein